MADLLKTGLVVIVALIAYDMFIKELLSKKA
jgi:hypothetical protein